MLSDEELDSRSFWVFFLVLLAVLGVMGYTWGWLFTGLSALPPLRELRVQELRR